MAHAPIAYTYEADHHCPDCAVTRFGRCAAHGAIACCVKDREGNTPGAIAPWEEWIQGTSECETLACGDCHAEIEVAHADPCTCKDAQEGAGDGE